MADYVEGIKGSKAVVVFGKSTCGFCTRVKKVLVEVLAELEMTADLEYIEIDKRNDTSAVQDYLLKITGARSVPRVFVHGKSVGGCDDTLGLHRSGALKKMIKG